MAKAAKVKLGRPKHTDDPPVRLSTTIPSSANELLRALKKSLGRPQSELITDAIRAYARRYPDIKDV